ncbi:MAG: GDP-mannose 4,6-dehydratase, partial [Thermodesulfobacteriota bacterium]
MKLLVTGGAGFIGSNFIRYLFSTGDDVEVVNLDALTYAGNLENLDGLEEQAGYRFVKGDIADNGLVFGLMAEGFDGLINFAAETHVDRSIHDSSPFLTTNVLGVQVLLEAARKYKLERFLHISTDEVYGS